MWCVLFVILVASAPQAGAVQFHSPPKQAKSGTTIFHSLEPFGHGGHSFTYEVMQTSEIQTDKTDHCLCDRGEFWNSDAAECVSQGDAGFHCGTFPKENMRNACKDGLKCAASQSTDEAVCRKCEANDSCKTGVERHRADCSKEVSLSGETCLTVSVKLPKGSTKAVTLLGESETCVSAEEARNILKIPRGTKVGTVLAEKIKSVAKERAYFQASSDAKSKVQKDKASRQSSDVTDDEAGEISDKIGDAERRETGKLVDEELAAEAKAWKEEAGDDEDAQKAASERELAVEEQVAKDAADRAEEANSREIEAEEAAAEAQEASAKADEEAEAAAAAASNSQAEEAAKKLAQDAAQAAAEAKEAEDAKNAMAAEAENAANEAESKATEADEAALDEEEAKAEAEAAQKKAEEEAKAAAEAEAMKRQAEADAAAAAAIADITSPDLPGQGGNAMNIIPRQDNEPKIPDRVNYSDEDMEALHP